MGRVIPILILCLTLMGAVYYVNRPKTVVSIPVPAKESCDFSASEMISKFNSVKTSKVTEDVYLDRIAQVRSEQQDYRLDNHAGFKVMKVDGTLSKYPYVAEVVAYSPCGSTSKEFDLWRNSPAHWAAITDERYDVVGIGFKNGVAVAIFGDLR